MLQAEVHGNGPRLVVGLCRQPAPGLRRAWADTGYQGRFFGQLGRCQVQRLLLLGAVVGWQDNLHQLRFPSLAQVQQLLVGQSLVLRDADGDPGLGVHARGHAGDAEVVEGQLFEVRLRRRARP
ncbi:hypothetical protein D3C80_1598430 [compost metagenome]